MLSNFQKKVNKARHKFMLSLIPDNYKNLAKQFLKSLNMADVSFYHIPSLISQK